MNNKDKYLVIMAGGVGSRFWPKSTERNPKQFLDVLGIGKTLIQLTFERFSSIVPAENVLVVTNEQYVNLVLEQLPQIKESNVLAEPCMRNTAPCLAYAIKKIEQENAEAVMIVSPADHLISKTDVFESVINTGVEYVDQHNRILTIGIQPDRPNTGYGYIEYDTNKKNNDHIPVDVVQFKEKPNLETAKEYIERGNFSWNSGMFLWSLKTILKSYNNNASDVIDLFDTKGEIIYGTDKEKEFILSVYSNCPSISVDYAILERADNVSVINTDIGWSDIGTWVSLQEHIQKNSEGNFVISGQTLMDNSEGNIVSLPHGRILATKGLNDFIVVESEGVLMIVSKEYEQDIKALRSEVGEKFGKEFI
ncbi:mannose-1-phosphate guanylyltransferase [bacterium SCSIO 12643]|nr:mannose-1-phosphate guanylyltransferase [bacterium SCSIO 12643]